MESSSTEIGLATTDAVTLADAALVRWTPRSDADLEADLGPRAAGTRHLLVVLPDVASAPRQLEVVADLAISKLGHRGAIEIDAAPRPPSVWTASPSPEAAADVLRRVTARARECGVQVTWRLPAHGGDELVDDLRSKELLGPGDALLLDLREADAAEVRSALARLQAPLERHELWLLGGVDPRRANARTAELTRFGQLRGLGAARLYWTPVPGGPVHRLWRRLADRMGGPQWGLSAYRRHPAASRVLVTGGAGFVGCNLTATLAERGHQVVVLDNLHRPGVERNLQWLEQKFEGGIEVVAGDVRCPEAVRECLDGVREVFHLAGQVAVTCSLDEPVEDFDINARGTLTVLEEMRRLACPPKLVFTSTNKVYGNLADVELEQQSSRYAPADLRLRARGVDETRPLDLHSPYGCSKGAGDQYVLDYAHTYGIDAVVFRMSCIYGPRQFGNEDQGWVAHFLRSALEDRPITIYGDGKQVRDLLFVGDLVEAFLLAVASMDRLRGQAFNIGGGPENAVSLLELLDRIGVLQGVQPRVEFAQWRRADQRYYVSDTSRFGSATGWRPRVGVDLGLQRLRAWLCELLGEHGQGRFLDPLATAVGK